MLIASLEKQGEGVIIEKKLNFGVFTIPAKAGHISVIEIRLKNAKKHAI